MSTESPALPRLLTPDEAAPLLYSSGWFVRQLIREGRIQTVKIGRRRFLTEAHIAEFLAHGGAELASRKPGAARKSAKKAAQA